jgi:hypothetical protein
VLQLGDRLRCVCGVYIGSRTKEPASDLDLDRSLERSPSCALSARPVIASYVRSGLYLPNQNKKYMAHVSGNMHMQVSVCLSMEKQAKAHVRIDNAMHDSLSIPSSMHFHFHFHFHDGHAYACVITRTGQVVRSPSIRFRGASGHVIYVNALKFPWKNECCCNNSYIFPALIIIRSNSWCRSSYRCPHVFHYPLIFPEWTIFFYGLIDHLRLIGPLNLSGTCGTARC